jgi:hypothetical protein
MRSITAFDGTEDDVVEKWKFGHLTVVRVTVILMRTILQTALPFG